MKTMQKASQALPDWLQGRAVPVAELKEYLATRLDESPCSYHFCDGSGEIPALMSTDAAASKGVRRCPCLIDRRNQKEYESLMKAGNMDSYKHMTYESSADKHPHQADAIRLMRSDPDGFYIFGPVGVGKTRLLACAVNQEIAAGRPAALITVPQLLAASHEVKGGISDLERLACRVPYLALDDIGKEKLSGYRASDEKNMLFRLMDARALLYERGLGFTSFSSQYPRDEVEGTASLKNKLEPELKEGQGSALMSRIRGMTMLIYLKGPDLRAGR